MGRERPRNGPVNRIFEGVCFRYIVREDRGSRWKLLGRSLVYHPMIQSIKSLTSIGYKPRRERIECRVKIHKISVALASQVMHRFLVAQTLESVDMFPHLSAIQSTGSHFLQAVVILVNTPTSRARRAHRDANQYRGLRFSVRHGLNALRVRV